MPYLGTSPTVGLVTKLNDIASGFNGVTTTFQLAIPPGGVTNYFTPGTVNALFVRLGGVTQNPGVDYTVSGSQITFTTAPAAGLTCFIIAIGQAINIGTPSDGSVGQSKLGTINSLTLTGATSGTTTIAAPGVSGNNTITLPLSNGTAYQIFRNGAIAGTTEFVDKIVSATAQASTSGTSVDFTSIPTWVKRITVMFTGVSTNGSNSLQVQLGAGSFVTSGYLGAGSNSAVGAVNFTTGFGSNLYNVNTAIFHGALTLSLLTGNTWVASGVFARSDSTATGVTSGSIALGGTLDSLRVIGSATGTPSDTFDAGTINIIYE